MDPYNRPRMRFPLGEYAQYLYAAGLINPASRPSNPTAPPSWSAPYARYDFSTDRAVRQRMDGLQTVEQVIARGYFAVPRADPATALLSDRGHSAWLGLDDVIHQIRQRHEIYKQNMYDLDQSVCEAHNAVFRQEAAQGAPANQRQQYSATKRIQTIYELKRAERVELWRDVVRIRASLPEAAQQYLSAYRKLSLLKDVGGDVP